MRRWSYARIRAGFADPAGAAKAMRESRISQRSLDHSCGGGTLSSSWLSIRRFGGHVVTPYRERLVHELRSLEQCCYPTLNRTKNKPVFGDIPDEQVLVVELFREIFEAGGSGARDAGRQMDVGSRKAQDCVGLHSLLLRHNISSVFRDGITSTVREVNLQVRRVVSALRVALQPSTALRTN